MSVFESWKASQVESRVSDDFCTIDRFGFEKMGLLDIMISFNYFSITKNFEVKGCKVQSAFENVGRRSQNCIELGARARFSMSLIHAHYLLNAFPTNINVIVSELPPPSLFQLLAPELSRPGGFQLSR